MMQRSDPLKRVHDILAKTKPAMAYQGGDFSKWQTQARDKLSQLLGLDQMEPCAPQLDLVVDEERPEYRYTAFRFQSEPGYWTPCCLLTPKGEGPFPLAICLQGHSKGMHISLGEPQYPGDAESIAGGRDFARQAVAEGYCALTIEQRGMGLCGGNEDGPQCYNHTMANLLLGRTTLGERVWDISRALDVVAESFPQADMSRVLCMGNSGGGTATFYAACMEERIGLAVPSCSICTYGDSIMAMHHCSCNFVPQIRRFFDMGDLAGLIAPRPLLVVAGAQDKIFPLKGVQESFRALQALYQAAGAGEACGLVVGTAGHQFYPAEAWPEIRRLAGSVWG